MLKNNLELLMQILDDYASGTTNSLEMLAKRNGISLRTLFTWLKDKTLIIPEFMGRENITFGQAMQQARNVMKAVTVGRTLEDYVLNGRRVEVWHHGRPQFEEDEGLVKLGEAFVRDVLGLPDMYRRDDNGNRILATRVEYAPAQLIEKYASANMPNLYGNKSEVTMRGQVALGVATIAGPQRPIPAEVQARLAELRPAQITETVKLAPATDTVEQYEPEDGFAALPSDPQPEAAPVTAISDIAEPAPTPLAFDDFPSRPARTPLERKLYDELEKARARKAALQ